MESTEKPKTVLEIIAKAIRRRSVMSFTYEDSEPLVVEPIVLGISKETGKHILRCYKSFPLTLRDSAENWLVVELDKIANLKTTPMRSKSFRKGSKTLVGDLSEVVEISDDYESSTKGLLDRPDKD